MRYVINDDDLEDWYSILYKANLKLKDLDIDYVLDEMEKEISNIVPAQNIENFLKLLRDKK